MTVNKIKIGVSSCLLGAQVRYDGGHKHDRYLTDTLGRFFEYVPVCPEVEIGMSVPREAIDLHGEAENPRLIGQDSGVDYAGRMHTWAEQRLQTLLELNLHGYILKQNSPSCGLKGVRLYNDIGTQKRNGMGIFARRLGQAFPLLPIEEESRLGDPDFRNNFIERIFAHHRLTALLSQKPHAKNIAAFHSAHKLTLLAHSRARYQELGRLIATAGMRPIDEIVNQYAESFMAALACRATPRKQADVLYHIIGYFKKLIDAEDKAELIDSIEKYRSGFAPLIVPLTLIKHHLRRHPIDWLKKQVYLNPFPEELMLCQTF